jgi:CHAT domain-containing protein/tetratricopeptide (TPR) repeat protein
MKHCVSRFWCLWLAAAASPLVAQTTQQAATLETLTSQIESATAKRQWAEAIVLGQKALAIEEAVSGANDPEVAGTLTLIAGWMRELDRNAEAEALLRRALIVFETSYGGAHEYTISAANNLAATLEALGRLEDANKIYSLTLDNMVKLHGPSHRLTAMSTNNLAFNLARQGRYQEAQPLYDKALKIGRATMDDDDPERARIENNVASNLTARGRYLQAEPLYNHALKTRLAVLGPDDADVATSYNSLAFNLSAQGRHEDAAPLFARALAIRQKANSEDRRAATSYNNVAHNLNARGRPIEAAPLYARALSIWQKLYGEQNPLTAIGLSNVATNLEAQGKVVDAQPLFERALKVRMAILDANHPDLAGSYFKVAHNFRLQGKSAVAEPYYQRAIAIRRQALGPLHPDLALGLADYAELAMGMGPGRSADALKFAREAANIARKRRDQSLTGEAAGDAGAEQQALARAQGADASRIDPLARSFGTLLKAEWQRAASAVNEADALKVEGFEAAQDLETSVAALTMAQTAARTAAGTGPLTELVRQQQDLSAKGRELDRRLLAALTNGNQPEAERLRTEIARTGEALSAADTALRRQFPDYAELVQPRALSVADTRSRLAADEALLLVVPVGDDIFSFGVSKDKLVWNRLSGGTAKAVKAIALLHCQIDPGPCAASLSDAELTAGAAPNSAFLADQLSAYDRASAFALYRDLVAPVEVAFAGKTRLFVTVTGALGGLPLGVLITQPPAPGEDGADPTVLANSAWLADRYAMVALPSVSVLRALKRKPVDARGAAVFVGYGAPVLAGAGAGGSSAKGTRLFQSVDADGATIADPEVLRMLDPLPGTARELAAMASALKAPAKDVLLGAAATETAVRGDPNLARARIVAFATHGILPREVSGIEEPGLVFTPPATASASDDGLLAASEVSRLTMSADWVLLSACNTASSDGTPGADSLSSLARSFLYAGAAALLASHWRVSDEATAALTVETLSGRSEGGLTRAEALQRAMRAVRTGKRADGTAVKGWDESWAHPAAWGAFAVISNADD